VSVAAALVLRVGDESKLSSLARSSTVEAGLAQRARIVLLAAQGVPNAEIGRRVGVSRPTVIQWRNRYEAGGIAALGDLDRSGRPPVIDDLAVVVATIQAPPAALGATHWSARLLLGKHLGISFASVARIWAGVESAAVAARDVQVLHRPRVGRQGS
jgi:transposase